MTTVRDIAAEAGVSAMTVSNVINGRTDKVSVATAERVRSIMARTGYVPNGPATALSTSRSNIVALIHAASGRRSQPSPHDSIFLDEVERRVTGTGRFLMIRSADDVAQTSAELRSWRVDGAIVLGAFASEADEVQAQLGLPLVFVDNYSTSSRISRVGLDDFQGGLLAARELIGAGHRRLALVAPGVDRPGVIHQRYLGFRAAVAEASLDRNSLELIDCEPFFDPSWELGSALARRQDRPTGLFATADIIAIGLLKGMAEAGVQVPTAASIVGFDDLPEARYVTPSLTTIRQDIPAKAQAAVDALLTLIEGNERPAEVRLPVTLCRRGSVAPAPPD
ncbi:LacI family DNA-binding transcriptional regulator [Tessaracoccus defluvii]|uniref:LacI family DNA-binding transcriptional regulator n=1 Tax=Tessaracoccus defluvii TaxID=1285901 RepID=A0A7H0H6T9_9ACTN|nr:LacI family DNA-binding transcriptional regulator [Tessaracoccus defluvii]QNP56255.1 LacI family DNA-binding transcriptional regulator [Tessaracoccus defluvii]